MLKLIGSSLDQWETGRKVQVLPLYIKVFNIQRIKDKTII